MPFQVVRREWSKRGEWFARISHREIRKTAIRPILLRHSGDSGSVTYATTVCSLTTHLLFLVFSAFSRFLTCAGEKCRFAPPRRHSKETTFYKKASLKLKGEVKRHGAAAPPFHGGY